MASRLSILLAAGILAQSLSASASDSSFNAEMWSKRIDSVNSADQCLELAQQFRERQQRDVRRADEAREELRRSAFLPPIPKFPNRLESARWSLARWTEAAQNDGDLANQYQRRASSLRQESVAVHATRR